MIVIAGTATIQPEYWDEAVERSQQMVAATEAEEGCISYRFYVDPTARNTFFIFEEWENEQALARHFQTPHLQSFSAYLAQIVADKTAIKRYEVATVVPL